MKKESAVFLSLMAGAAGALALCRAGDKLSLRSYPIVSDKIKNPLKILQISDLHSSQYGRNYEELLEAISKISPDIIVMTGDILDNRALNGACLRFLKNVSLVYPCYYVSGNHEVYTHFLPAIKEKLRSYGIRVLEGETDHITVGGQSIAIAGLDDPTAFPDKKGMLWEDNLVVCSQSLDGGRFSILLTHRPEHIGYYEETPFDLVLSGHAHGGQVIIPNLVNGLYAPNQGFFPKYAGGEYIMSNGGRMIVSRGLSRLVKPRIFNRPELVLVTLLPSEEIK